MFVGAALVNPLPFDLDDVVALPDRPLAEAAPPVKSRLHRVAPSIVGSLDSPTLESDPDDPLRYRRIVKEFSPCGD
jgi:hypothetical protein